MYRYPRQTLPAISPSIWWWQGIIGAQADWGPVFTVLFVSRGPVIIYRLPRRWGVGVKGGRILAGITWFLGEQKGGSFVIENPKEGWSLKTLKGFRWGTTQICLENEDMREGSRTSSNVIRGDHSSEVTLNFTMLSPKSSPRGDK